MHRLVGVGDLRRIKADGTYRINSDRNGSFKGSAGFIGKRSGERIYTFVLEANISAVIGQRTFGRICKGERFAVFSEASVDLQTVRFHQLC